MSLRIVTHLALKSVPRHVISNALDLWVVRSSWSLQAHTHIFNMSPMSKTLSSSAKESIPTVQELAQKLAKQMGIEIFKEVTQKARADLDQYLPKKQEELPARTMRDSFLEGLIPLSSELHLQDKYKTFLGFVRFGRLLEDMDIFAVIVAHKHIFNPKIPATAPSPYTLVTALVDRIHFSDFMPKLQEDIKISGHVSWVGQTSLEVMVWLEQKAHGTWHIITRALFLVAARDFTNTKSAIVNALKPADDQEKDIMAGGQARKQARLDFEKTHVSRVIPNIEEQNIIHNLYLKTVPQKGASLMKVIVPPEGVWMSECTISNTILAQPEHRNLHNTVFGGFIMRQASELSWVLAFKFSKYRPKVKSINDIKFSKPIAVHSLIYMHAFVLFTHMQFIQIVVHVEVFDPQVGSSTTTNTVHFTYEVPSSVKEVFPSTYQEAMMYIDGRRHFFEVMKEGQDDTFKASKL